MSVIWGLKEMIEWKKETKWVVDKWDQKVKAAHEACVFMNGILEESRMEESRLKGDVVSLVWFSVDREEKAKKEKLECNREEILTDQSYNKSTIKEPSPLTKRMEEIVSSSIWFNKSPMCLAQF